MTSALALVDMLLYPSNQYPLMMKCLPAKTHEVVPKILKKHKFDK
jgi:hypothetical protein